MERSTLVTKSGKPGNVEDLPIENTNHDCDTILNDDKKDYILQTFFQRPLDRSSVRKKIFCDDENSFELSDSYSESENEIDNETNVLNYIKSPPLSHDSCVTDDTVLSSRTKTIVDSNVTLNQTPLIESNQSTTSHNKRFLNEETSIASTKRRKLQQGEKVPKGNTGMKFKDVKQHCKYENIRSDGIVKNIKNEVSLKNKIPLQKKILPEQLKKVSWSESLTKKMSDAILGSRNISQQFNYFMKTVPSNDVVSRRNKIIVRRITRNRSLLRALKEVINVMNISNQDPPSRSNHKIWRKHTHKNISSVGGIKTAEKRDNGFKKFPKDQTMRKSPIQRPDFRNSKIERLLDKSMDAAIKKYRKRENAWGKMREKTRTT